MNEIMLSAIVAGGGNLRSYFLDNLLVFFISSAIFFYTYV